MDKTEKKTRDRLGRWVKGVTGNAKGRPLKFARLDAGDLLTFKNTAIEVTTPDGSVLMTREAAIQHRMYQSAMKGNVHAQIFLARRFERFKESNARILDGVNRIISDLRKHNRPLTDHELTLIEMARAVMTALPLTDEDVPKVPLGRKRHGKPKRKGNGDGGSGS